MTPMIPTSIELIGDVLLIAAAVGIIGMGVIGLLQAYYNPLFAFSSKLPLSGVSAQDYDLPDKSQSEQLAQFPELEDLDVRIHNSDSKVSGGETAGFKFGPIGVPGIALTASAFDNPKHLAAIIAHELSHRKNGDITTDAFYTMITGGLALFALSLFAAMCSIMFSVGQLDVLPIIFIVFLISIVLIICTQRRFRNQYYYAEYDADRRAVQRLGSPEALKTLLRHYSDNRDEDEDEDEDEDDNLGSISQLLGKEYPHPDKRLERIKKD